MFDLQRLLGRGSPAQNDELARLPGETYGDVLLRLHTELKPSTYLEIGTRSGGTLKLANCNSIAVDPKFQITSDIIGDKPCCMLFQSTSDDFFRDHNPAALLGGPIDVAFLDGMHLFEFLLRDFLNVELHCRPNSIIALHDCVPIDLWMAERVYTEECMKKSRFEYWWTGDVWKILPILKKYRPDLSIAVLDAEPTGLVLVSNLDPKSAVLADNYTAIVADYAALTLAEYGLKRHHEECALLPTQRLSELIAHANFAQ
jgi:hypothetical protein